MARTDTRKPRFASASQRVVVGVDNRSGIRAPFQYVVSGYLRLRRRVPDIPLGSRGGGIGVTGRDRVVDRDIKQLDNPLLIPQRDRHGVGSGIK
jgi:hypothetical protein